MRIYIYLVMIASNIYKLLRKKEKKIKNIHFSKLILFNYAIVLLNERLRHHG